MERWSIAITKEYLKFSAAHFLIFPDGEAERLHGHNYQVAVEVGGELGEHGLVLDFNQVKPRIRKLVDAWDQRWLVPGEHRELRLEEVRAGAGNQPHLAVTYRQRCYRAPAEEVLVLPLNNTSTENLAALLGRQLWRDLEANFPGVSLEFLRLSVEETAGQRGVYHYTNAAPGKLTGEPGAQDSA
ncbi:MAG: 6-carboxytetrahydropterin synthase [Planctomycetota bacterium]|jgi:6-pyruvoyltetrahydropterin/6-carboxytetrahydropterin synthase|nr:6-pyruvoyl tetrahydropterin synthase [Planctomycetota bacterium]MDP6520210.1 6-carboxytetrahydropterin synthase [Planctomycetota bacterium]MDP6838000.1 6-carboxytetrahydropterin synthase [Planctomycetota bacterium]